MSFYQENRPEQKRFYSGKKWRKLRDKYLKEHPLCERCAAVGRAEVAEHVHHKIELNENFYNTRIQNQASKREVQKNIDMLKSTFQLKQQELEREYKINRFKEKREHLKQLRKI